MSASRLLASSTARADRSPVAETPLSVPLDRTSPVPLYCQLAQELERRIREGELPPGTRLENEILLTDRLGLSRPTLPRGIEHLADLALLVRKRGAGTPGVTPPVCRPVELFSLYDDRGPAGQ